MVDYNDCLMTKRDWVLSIFGGSFVGLMGSGLVLFMFLDDYVNFLAN